MDEKLFEKTAYHTTAKDRAESILKNKFFYESTQTNEWLGSGIYFWDDIDDAKWWRSNVKGVPRDKTVMIEVYLKCKYSEYRDLNIKENMKEFEAICEEVINNKFFRLGTLSEVELRNFYCNYYKRKLGIKLLEYNFRRDKEFNKFGFKKDSTQYCLGEKFQKEILEIKGVIENV